MNAKLPEKTNKATNTQFTYAYAQVDVIDAEGNPRRVDCRFRLSFNDALSFFSKTGKAMATYSAAFESGADQKNPELTMGLYQETVEFLTELLSFTYGYFPEGPDGRLDMLSFIRNQRTYDYFRNSVMLDAMLKKILTEDDFFAKFKDDLLPAEFMEAVKQAQEDAPATFNSDPLPFIAPSVE